MAKKSRTQNIPAHVEECDSCSFKTRKLHRVGPPFGKPDVEDNHRYLCDLCFGSHAGNTIIYPGQYPDGRVLQHMALFTNLIIQAINNNK